MLDRFDELRPQLEGTGPQPCQLWRASRSLSKRLKEALLWAIAQVLAAEFDRETRAAWDKLLTTVCEAMLRE